MTLDNSKAGIIITLAGALSRASSGRAGVVGPNSMFAFTAEAAEHWHTGTSLDHWQTGPAGEADDGDSPDN